MNLFFWKISLFILLFLFIKNTKSLIITENNTNSTSNTIINTPNDWCYCNLDCECDQTCSFCLKCYPGDYMFRLNCIHCVRSPCLSCVDEQGCTNCVKGYYLQSDPFIGYYCLPCGGHCSQCVGDYNTNCTECEVGYQIDYMGNCFQCVPHCTQCAGPAWVNECTECLVGYELKNNSCIEQNNDGNRVLFHLILLISIIAII